MISYVLGGFLVAGAYRLKLALTVISNRYVPLQPTEGLVHCETKAPRTHRYSVSAARGSAPLSYTRQSAGQLGWTGRKFWASFVVQLIPELVCLYAADFHASCMSSCSIAIVWLLKSRGQGLVNCSRNLYACARMESQKSEEMKIARLSVNFSILLF